MKSLKLLLYIDKSVVHGRGLFARYFIRKGTRLNFVSRKKIKGNKQYYGEFLNHSDSPNLIAIKAITDGKLIKAACKTCRNISKGEELTINYDKTIIKNPKIKVEWLEY